MCGILGFITDKPSEENYKLLGRLLHYSADRGTDATGIAIATPKNVLVIKEDIAADKFLKKYYTDARTAKEIAKSHIVLGHTRLATQGHQSDNNNNHPIIGPKYIMVHNGTCPSMDRIKDYKYRGTVDSEILLSHIEMKGIEDGCKDLRGSAAIALISATSEEATSIHLWRHNNPLWLAYNEGKKTLFFGSTEDILRDGLSDLLNFFSSFTFRQIPEDWLYKVSYNPISLQEIKEIEPIGYKGVWSKGHKGVVVDRNYYDNMSGYGYGYGVYDMSDEGGYGDSLKDKSTATAATTEPTKEKPKESPGFAAFYREITKCRWDAEKKQYTTDPLSNQSTTSRYYFDGPSNDFEHWSRLSSGGHISIDKKFAKFFDHTKKAHFLITVTEAIKQGLIEME